MKSAFDRHIGIDYSGRSGPDDPLQQIQVGAAGRDEPLRLVPNPRDPQGHWSRHDLAYWLDERLNEPGRMIVGIDHAFSFPGAYLNDHKLRSWDEFLDWFEKRWPTREVPVKELLARHGAYPTRELRLTERWTSSAKSVFQMDGPGNVGRSTHCGIPWLAWLRRRHRDRIHFWPFDGLTPPPDRSVVAEVYPSIFRHRYVETIQKQLGVRELSPDERDALSVALWLSTTDESGFLPRYFVPPLTEWERDTVLREGWILGVA